MYGVVTQGFPDAIKWCLSWPIQVLTWDTEDNSVVQQTNKTEMMNVTKAGIIWRLGNQSK